MFKYDGFHSRTFINSNVPYYASRWGPRLHVEQQHTGRRGCLGLQLWFCAPVTCAVDVDVDVDGDIDCGRGFTMSKRNGIQNWEICFDASQVSVRR